MDICPINIVINGNYGYRPVSIVIGESPSSWSLIIVIVYIYCTIIPITIVIGENSRYCPVIAINTEKYSLWSVTIIFGEIHSYWSDNHSY
jgi:hypothetical protein